MRIGLNLLHAMPEIGGGWNYIERLVESLGKYDNSNRYIAFVTDKSERLVPRQPNFELVHIKINSAFRPLRILYENTLLQMAARKHGLALMHWFANTIAFSNSVPGVVTVYDLHVYENPSAFAWPQRIYLRTMLPRTARRAALLLPMSDTTARALCRVVGNCAGRIQIVPPIVGESFNPSPPNTVKELRQKYALPEEMWLYVAHFYPHKNHVRLLESYHELKLNGFMPWTLVLRGDDHGVEDEVKRLVIQLGLEKDVRFLPRLSEQELPVLYSAATALVFPSLYEGGGIPLLEAMACGCPIIASDISAVREFGGDAISRFDPLSVQSIRNAIKELQQDAGMRHSLQQLGIDQIQNNRPNRVIDKLICAYGHITQRSSLPADL